MILAATGTMTHNGASNLSWPDGYAFMYFSHVKEANMRVFDAEKELSADPNFSYVNMLPDQAFLPSKNPRYVVIEGLDSRTDLLNTRNPRNAFRIQVSTKASRNKKHIAFATICFMWMKVYYEKDRIHACKSALEIYQGLQSIGCVRYAEKVGIKRVQLCSRLNGGSCIEDPANQTMVPIYEVTDPKVCILMEDIRTGKHKIGEGVLYPFMKMISSAQVLPVAYAIKLTKVGDSLTTYETPFAGKYASPIPSSGKRVLLSSLLNKIIPWKIQSIRRVTILHSFKKPIGTAILVGTISDLCKENERNGSNNDASSGESTNFPVAASGSVANHNNLAVICNLKILRDRPELRSLRYPFFEWYDIPFLNRFKPLHFPMGKHEPPKILNANELNSCNSLFWNEKWISE